MKNSCFVGHFSYLLGHSWWISRRITCPRIVFLFLGIFFPRDWLMIFLMYFTANWLEGRTIKYTNFPVKYMNSRSKLHWNIHVVLCLVSVTWNKRWGIGIPELHYHAERHSAFIANWFEAKTIIFRYFLARYRNFLPQVDQKVHQVLQNLPQALCIGDVIRYAEKKL